MAKRKHYEGPIAHRSFKASIWDVIFLLIFIAVMTLLAWGASQLTTPYNVGETLNVELDPKHLPYYAASSVLRMLIALFFSLLATFTIGALAAKSQRAERIIIPLIDILQSVPVLGFLTFTVLAFIQLFPGSLLGPQCAAIFAIFTAQAWNMILSFYGTIKLIPHELEEACSIFHLSAWRRFWHLDVPYSMPGLVWNTMMSMSSSWFFVVASEAITVNNQTITLPGIGSYIRLAIQQGDFSALTGAILAMLVVILLYDQLLFRPLLAWSEKFKPNVEDDPVPEQGSWFLDLLHRTRLLKYIAKKLSFLKEAWFSLFSFHRGTFSLQTQHTLKKATRFLTIVLWIFTFLGLLYSVVKLFLFIQTSITWMEVLHVFKLGAITLFKVSILLIIATIIWVPMGVWIGLNPKLTNIMQPVVQFLAAFPANLFYPIFAIYILKYHLNPEIWSAPLMILGTQWYILFNVIAGTTMVPKELKLAAQTFQLKGTLWWKRFMIPAIFPYYVTGSITAAGGCWNATIVADVIIWGEHRIEATGLGSYIVHASDTGNFSQLALGCVIMCVYVVVLDRLVWHKLYLYAQERYQYG